MEACSCSPRFIHKTQCWVLTSIMKTEGIWEEQPGHDAPSVGLKCIFPNSHISVIQTSCLQINTA